MIALPPGVEQTSFMLETRARVVEVGPCCWADEREPRAHPGDLVIISKMAGALVKGPLDGEMYRVVNDRDIYLGIEEGESNG